MKWSEAAQSCPTLCDSMDCSLQSSSVHGTLQARVLEWVAISFSRGSSRPRDRIQVSRIAGRRFTIWATREGHKMKNILNNIQKSYSPSTFSSRMFKNIIASTIIEHTSLDIMHTTLYKISNLLLNHLILK